MRHSIKWYRAGKKIIVNDKMQRYTYTLSENPGENMDFKPELTPEKMLAMGVFEGKYLNDCVDELPKEWYKGKFSDVPDETVNYFGIKSRLSLQEWQKRGWIIGKDVRGWFQWYCRYWLGRRDPAIDTIQIKRWFAFRRHRGQIVKSLKKINHRLTKKEMMIHRPRQRQALLQWAYNPFVNME